MSKFDHSDIDGRLLQVLRAVFEEQSVTRAAARLDVTQSAVSQAVVALALAAAELRPAAANAA